MKVLFIIFDFDTWFYLLWTPYLEASGAHVGIAGKVRAVNFKSVLFFKPKSN